MKTFKNVKLFQAQNIQGLLISLDIEDLKNDKFAGAILINWLKNNHEDIYWDIELHEKGSVNLEEYTDGYKVVFSGDNGIFILEEVKIERIVFNPMS